MRDLHPIFKAYDVRGRTDTGDLDEDAARRIGAGFARSVDAPQVALGHDCRASSPGLVDAFSDGVTGQGVDVLDIGLVATDTLYFVSGDRDIPGAMITASHNPPEWNGIKFCRRGAAPIGAESGLFDIRDLAEQGVDAIGASGSVEPFDPIPGYIDHLLSIVDPQRIGPLRVAADGGNGMAGVALPGVFAKLDAELIPLFLEPDGRFPNHPADPLQPENLRDLEATMRSQHPDLGVAFDGDADRAFFVDDLSRPLSGSTTTALIATWFLAREPGAKIVHNLIVSRAVPEAIRAAGGTPVRTRVGHSFIKQIMAETGAVFGGEHSGHYYFRDNFRADSGTLAMLVLLQVLSEDGRSLSEIRKDFEPYVASGEINLRVDDQQDAIERVAATFGDASQDRTDGLTVEWADRWFNLRSSNTEPVLRLNAEAGDKAAVEELVATVRSIVKGT
ncbi:MAG: phosphomannomutase/phosphoglucomutase [Gammaproteobacteria bacterium]|nr:phosphomannomutase/phosphoglucomutase [Gammaproteobacteria bacterium]